MSKPIATTPAEARAFYGYAPAFIAALSAITEATGKTFAEVIAVARKHRDAIGDMSFLTSEMIEWNRAALGLDEAGARKVVDIASRAYAAEDSGTRVRGTFGVYAVGVDAASLIACHEAGGFARKL